MAVRAGSLLILLAMGLVWGLQVTMLKLSLSTGYGELQLMLITLLLVTVTYFAVLVARGGLFRFTWPRLKFFCTTALLGYLLPMAVILYASHTLAAGMLALIISTAPLFTFAAAFAGRTETISRMRLWAMLLGLLATTLVLWPEFEAPGYGEIGWLLLALVVPLCYGIESVYIDVRWPEGLDVFQIGFGEVAIAALMVLPLLAWQGEPIALDWAWDAGHAAILVYVFTGISEVVMYFHLIRTTGGVLVAFATPIALFGGIGWGMVVFGESHSAWVWVAVFVLLLSLALVGLDARGPKRHVDATHPS